MHSLREIQKGSSNSFCLIMLLEYYPQVHFYIDQWRFKMTLLDWSFPSIKDDAFCI